MNKAFKPLAYGAVVSILAWFIWPIQGLVFWFAWNNFAPTAFGGGELSFWQAMCGVMVISTLRQVLLVKESN